MEKCLNLQCILRMDTMSCLQNPRKSSHKNKKPKPMVHFNEETGLYFKASNNASQANYVEVNDLNFEYQLPSRFQKAQCMLTNQNH